MADTTDEQAVVRVVATPAALALIARFQATHGALMFYQSGGCCEGSVPMCFPQGEFLLGSGDVQLGEIGGVPFYIGKSQYQYWKHTQLIIDVVEGRSGAFSLEAPEGLIFHTRSRLFTDDEWADLQRAGAV